MEHIKEMISRDILDKQAYHFDSKKMLELRVLHGTRQISVGRLTRLGRGEQDSLDSFQVLL